MQRHELHELRSLMAAAVTIGTRGSRLALWQTDWVKTALTSHHPSLGVEILPVKTIGDKILDVPLAKIGGKGLFVKEIEEALLAGRIDIAVHSMKDMPVVLPDGLLIGAVPRRERAEDVLISNSGEGVADLPQGARIGTSSLRRAAQLLAARPDFIIMPLRGNLDTRLRKLEAGEMDAIVLAAAGVKRMEMEDRVTEWIDPDLMLPAVGQGALCIEIRREDPGVRDLIAVLDDPETRCITDGERAFLRRLEGGCQVPMAAYGRIKDGHYTLAGMIAELDGSKIYKHVLVGPPADAENIGVALAERLIDMGGGDVVARLMEEAGLS